MILKLVVSEHCVQHEASLLQILFLVPLSASTLQTRDFPMMKFLKNLKLKDQYCPSTWLRPSKSMISSQKGSSLVSQKV